jgi:hypothetical protein
MKSIEIIDGAVQATFSLFSKSSLPSSPMNATSSWFESACLWQFNSGNHFFLGEGDIASQEVCSSQIYIPRTPLISRRRQLPNRNRGIYRAQQLRSRRNLRKRVRHSSRNLGGGFPVPERTMGAGHRRVGLAIVEQVRHFRHDLLSISPDKTSGTC